MGFANGTVINAANVNQHVVTQTPPAKPKKAKAAAPKPEVAEVKAKESAPAES